MCTRLLFSILPAPYTQQSFSDLLAEMATDLTKLYHEGITVSNLHICGVMAICYILLAHAHH